MASLCYHCVFAACSSLLYPKLDSQYYESASVLVYSLATRRLSLASWNEANCNRC